MDDDEHGTAAGMNAFERHGITHLSPSSLNSYATQPALWVMERLFKHWAARSALGCRGNAIEHGVNEGLYAPEKPVEDCIALALTHYDREMALSTDPKRAAERKNIPGCVTYALEELRKYGIPTGYQLPAEIMVEGVSVPIRNKLDWKFDQHGLIVDLKTAEKLPSAISNNHGRQGSIYSKSHGNYAVRFAYARPTPRKDDGRAVVVYPLDPMVATERLHELTLVAQRLERFLSLSTDKHELAALVVPDYDHWLWNNPQTRAMGREVYGF